MLIFGWLKVLKLKWFLLWFCRWLEDLFNHRSWVEFGSRMKEIWSREVQLCKQFRKRRVIRVQSGFPCSCWIWICNPCSTRIPFRRFWKWARKWKRKWKWSRILVGLGIPLGLGELKAISVWIGFVPCGINSRINFGFISELIKLFSEKGVLGIV